MVCNKLRTNVNFCGYITDLNILKSGQMASFVFQLNQSDSIHIVKSVNSIIPLDIFPGRLLSQGKKCK